MSEELKPCPFTGEKPVFSMWTPSDGRHRDYAAGVWIATIASSEISIEKSSRGGEEAAKSAAIAAWNRRATLSPAHIEDGEEVEVVAWQYRVTAGPQTGWSLWNPGKGEEFESSYTVERRPLMTVAQHQRIVAARASRAAARVEDEREACERWIRQQLGMPARIPMDWDGPFNRYTWAAWSARAALSAPPAAGVPEGYVLAPIKPTIEMVEAGYEASLGQPDRSAHARVIEQYDAMLAEVPPPPASEQQNRCPHDSWRYGGGPCGDCGEVQFSKEELLRLNRPASEQQRAVVMPERGVYPSMSMYSDRKEYAAAVGEVSGRNACLDELLRLNPHLAKGEGV